MKEQIDLHRDDDTTSVSFGRTKYCSLADQDFIWDRPDFIVKHITLMSISLLKDVPFFHALDEMRLRGSDIWSSLTKKRIRLGCLLSVEEALAKINDDSEVRRSQQRVQLPPWREPRQLLVRVNNVLNRYGTHYYSSRVERVYAATHQSGVLHLRYSQHKRRLAWHAQLVTLFTTKQSTFKRLPPG